MNITKAMGQQMEDQGIEWRCSNCVKNAKGSSKGTNKAPPPPPKDNVGLSTLPAITKELSSKTSCIVCKRPASASSIYYSDACILKHAQDSLGSPSPSPSGGAGGMHEKLSSESRVIVFERKSGRLLGGPNAPTAENLKSWLQKSLTFEVVRLGTLSAIKPNVAVKKFLQQPMKILVSNFERESRSF